MDGPEAHRFVGQILTEVAHERGLGQATHRLSELGANAVRGLNTVLADVSGDFGQVVSRWRGERSAPSVSPAVLPVQFIEGLFAVKELTPAGVLQTHGDLVLNLTTCRF